MIIKSCKTHASSYSAEKVLQNGFRQVLVLLGFCGSQGLRDLANQDYQVSLLAS